MNGAVGDLRRSHDWRSFSMGCLRNVCASELLASAMNGFESLQTSSGRECGRLESIRPVAMPADPEDMRVARGRCGVCGGIQVSSQASGREGRSR